MPYVRRDAAGQVDSLHRHPAPGADEFLADDHADVRAFLGAGDDGFVRLDAAFVRVIEDVIDTLIVKHVINVTDLPAEAQAKLFARKSFRERVARNSLKLFGDGDLDSAVIGSTGR